MATLDDLFIMARDHKLKGKRSLVAAIYKGHRLISVGFNDYRKSHPLQKKYGRDEHSIFLHAELDAILNARTDVRGCTLYIARAKKVQGKWVKGLAKPCFGCSAALEAFGIQQVFYTEDES